MSYEIIWMTALAVTASVASGALSVLWLVTRRGPRIIAETTADRTTFLIEHGRVVDATPPAREILDGLGAEGVHADRLIRWLSDSFPGLPEAIRALPQIAERSVVARDGIGRLLLARERGLIRLTLGNDENARVEMDRVCQTAVQAELDTLRAIGDGLPYPVWREDREGRIRWVNRAYLDLLSDLTGETTHSWPPRPLFEDEILIPGVSKRLAVRGRWFECHAISAGEETLVSAVPADALVKAETALDTFRQTMSRTFAHLTVGLAIFDDEKRLAVFNPALTDMTTLPIDVLTGRPTLESFLDALRARNMMPEPRDYGSWRERVADVELSAQSGTYSELWHLPGGRTYRITGRPQPDGAFALLMEDISAEMGLTRRFRSQIETGHAVLDALPEAIAVFDEAGTLTVSNAAYDELWQVDQRQAMTQISLADAIRCWIALSHPTPFWDRLTRPADSGPADSGPEEAERIRLVDGRLVWAVRRSLPGGSLMVRFLPHSAEVSPLRPATRRPGQDRRLAGPS